MRELRKAVTAGKKKRALVVTKLSATSASALQRPSGAGGETHISHDPTQLLVTKRKAEAISSSDCPFEAASRRPAPGHRFLQGPEAQGTTAEPAAQSSRQLGPNKWRDDI